MQNRRLLCVLLWLFLLSQALAEPDYSSPEATFKTYLQACQQGDYAAADDCYTASSRAFFAKNPGLTKDRQVEALTGTYERLSQVNFTTEQVSPKRAILHGDDPKVPPYFLRVQTAQEGWRIDWLFMANYIRANDNGWSWANPRAEGIWKSRP